MKKKTLEVKDNFYLNLLKDATFCITETHSFGNSRKIPEDKLKKITNIKLSKWVRANKGLIDKTALEEINSNISKFKKIFIDKALPSPFRSIFIIPNSVVMNLTKEADEQINVVNDAVKDFVPNYNSYIEAAKEELGKELFNIEDYPDDIASKFSCGYRFISFDVPSELKSVNPELYKEEMDKFKNTMEKTKNECILFLREAFLNELKDIIGSLTNEKNGKANRIRSETIDKIEKFFETFKYKNIFKDEEFLKIIDDARNIMCGITSKDLRNNEYLKNMITKEVKKVAKICENEIVSFRRKISL